MTRYYINTKEKKRKMYWCLIKTYSQNFIQTQPALLLVVLLDSSDVCNLILVWKTLIMEEEMTEDETVER